MATASIGSHAAIEALVHRNVVVLVVTLVALGPLHTAPESYELLRYLVTERNWVCDKLLVLEGLCRLALDLVNLRDHLLPSTQAQGATLHGAPNVLHSFVLMKKVANVLLRAKTDIKMRGRLMIGQVQELGKLLKGHANQVLLDSETIVAFQALPS